MCKFLKSSKIYLSWSFLFIKGSYIMITKEVREWLEKAVRGQYSYDDAMYEFSKFTSYLSRDELKFIKNKLENSYSK